MKKGLKIAIGLATVGVVGVGLYFLWDKVLRKKFNPSKEEEFEKEEEQKKELQGSSYTPPPDPYPSTPFKSKTEGNKFRKWINDIYPKYAKDIKLDAEGEYNNRFIRKAYKQYGTEYQAQLKGVGTSVGKATSSISKSKKVVVSGSYANIRSSAKVNNGTINNLLGKVSGKGTTIGTLMSSGKSIEYGDKKKWYKVKLTNRLKGRTFGYVREDTAKLK